MKKILCAIFLLGTVLTCIADTLEAEALKSAVCAACHGPQGVSSNPQWPNLAGQHASYLIKQMHDFKKGTTRNAATMAAVLTDLSDQDIVELANYYSNQSIAEGETPEKFLKRGELLYRGGDFSKHITACIACHGPKGTGNAQAGFPVLTGQHAEYTIQQLQAFKDRKRTNDLNSIMRDISERMSKEDMEAVAYYIQGLH
ncbi:c-type cytochrome [Legionella micdadei]|uniref:Cytochrome c4 n=1 Tax=Legionella micdadei TaxID=451 RepID=A0A098GC08_LEGMI|nr:c-type cytochrome [Legionella micdadei]ARG96309.1 cytochrome c4 [Legionella micdadei]KTD29134.1 cytochrome c4 [Legionella micdadei]NSL19421.1 cytochrome c4 [Legionella micdadei]CEG59502.1 Cytochrome c4 [Legionella micdadei]SCX91777.1 Cytochrome c553 [Legionella micdadei]